MSRKITLVNVVNEGALYRETRMPALSLAYLSAYIPRKWDVRIVDETVEHFDAFKHVLEGPDIIGLSGGNVCNVPKMVRMVEDIEIVGEITGVKPAVIVGGYAGSLDLEGLPSKVDSTVSGPGELAIRRLLADFESGKMQAVYKGERIPMDKLKTPDFSRFDVPKYGKNINWPVQTSVSCNNTCEFCSARKVYGQGYEARPVKMVLEDMEQFPDGSRIYFCDPNLVEFSKGGIERAKALFKEMKKRDFKWFGSVSFKVSEQDGLLRLMKESGCTGVLIGYDSASRATLEQVSRVKVPKGDLLQYYIDGTRKIQEKFGIPVLGTFVVGLDTDDKSVFENTVKVVKESGMSDAQYLDFTPLPGTAIYDQMVAAGRIFDPHFEHFDFTDVVFQPNNMTPRELRNGVVNMFDQTFPRMLKLYRRMGVIRDRPEEIRVESMKQREERERNERQRREGNGTH